MAASKKPEQRTFVVELASHRTELRRSVVVDGVSFEVNHRGDLVIFANRPTHSQDGNPVAAFRSGSWNTVQIQEPNLS